MVMNSAEARKRVENARDLPTLPSVASEIIRLANSPKTNAADVGRIIEQDQALTTKVLKLVNSAFYGFPGQIKTIQHAVVIIGFNKVKNVVMAATLFDMTKKCRKNGLDIPRFWLHALGAAIAARVCDKHFDKDTKGDDIFVAGLIHSIGLLIMDQIFPKECAEVRKLCETSDMSIVEAEREVFGFTNCQVGEWIAEKWRLPLMLRQSIRYYARPMQAREEIVAASCSHVGCSISRALGVGNPGYTRVLPIDPQLCSRFGLDAPMLDAIVGETLDELRLAKEFIELIGC